VDDIYDAEQRESVYVPEVAELIKRVTGAAEVRIFTHFLRGPEAQRRDPESISFTADFVHADYTPKSGPAAFQELLGEQAEQYSGHRFGIINVWRPIVGPMQDRPLAVCDASSVATDDLLPWMTVTRLDEKGLRSATGEIREDESYVTAWNPEHRWYYAPDMMPTEALLFKTYDSDTDQLRFTPHTAFNDPTTPADAPLRASIDVRALVIW
jgi:hypothetical protein